MASEWARKKAKELCYFEHDSRHDDKCGNCAIIASALDEARAEGERIGAERERWECHRIASDFSDRIGGSAGAVAIRIAGRGPMRGSEEGE